MTVSTILKRRSIRRFTAQDVAPAQIDTLLEAAFAAPSANNMRPAHFVVIRDRPTLSGITRIHPYAAMASQAPIAIVVCADTSIQPEPGYYAQDCSAATENILLAATDLGLGSVWCAIHPNSDRAQGFAELLGLPEGTAPFSLVVIGHPAERKDPHSGIDRNRVHSDRW
jgi:nitroreductase